MQEKKGGNNHCRECDHFDPATNVCTVDVTWQEVDPEQEACVNFIRTVE